MSDAASEVRLTDRVGIGLLTRLVSRDLIDEVLAETDRVERRHRLLPARVVVYYVMALYLFFGDAYEEVMRKLVGGLQFLYAWDRDWAVPSASALCQARQRLREEPMRALFDRVAQPILQPGTGQGWFGPWRVMALDGVMLDVPDTADNVERFGRSGNAVADSPFPQARVAALAECGFYSYEFWQQVRARNAQLLWRVQTQINLPVDQHLPDGSYLSALVPKSMRSAIAGGKKRRLDRYQIPVRVVDYTITNRGAAGTDAEPETIRLITSILDHDLAPAAELAALYHQRWEIEMALDEIQTHQMGRPRVLRSRSPQMVCQEIWALLLTHYAIRHLMHEAADQTGAEPDRISFMRSLRIIRRQVTDQAAFSPQQTRHNNHHRDR